MTVKRELRSKYQICTEERERHNEDIERLNKKLYRAREMYLEGLVEDEREYRQMIAGIRGDLEKSVVRSEAALLTFDEASESAENVARFVLQARQTFLSGDGDKKREIVSALATSQ